MIYPIPRLLPFGDAALLIDLADEISLDANAQVRGRDAALAAAPIPGVLETVPAYASLLVEYDPRRISYGELQERLAEPSRRLRNLREDAGVPLKEVPTRYGGEDGPDLEEVAARHNLTPAEVIAIHSRETYTVYMLGFSPGFAYMGAVATAISTPRLATPRTRVPAGSVGLAGRQTGIYPQSTPGGWRLLGRTDIPLFDPYRDPPAFFQPGDRVRFVPSEGNHGGTENTETHGEVDRQSQIGNRQSLEILSPGLLTTVQDLGRPGYQRYGVPVCGAVDALALRAANALVGNPPEAAGLEITLAGPTVRFQENALIAITGADLTPVLHAPGLDRWDVPLWYSVYVRKGSVLEFGGQRSGCRAYLAVAGGIDTPPVMGSRSTYLAGGFGGYGGRPLVTGDLLPVGPAAGHLPNLAGRCLPPEDRPAYSAMPTVRVVPGPHHDQFSAAALRALLSQEYQVTPTSDRMGLRLSGPALEHAGAPEIVSCGIALGAIQVPPNGQPILLLADRQTAGGYPIIATVIRADIPLLAQCLPGQSSVRFQAVSMAEAQGIHSRRRQSTPTG